MNKTIMGCIVYAGLVLVGGIIGFVKADSIASLAMGSGFALALLLSAYSMTKRQAVGYFSSVGLTTLLALFFGYRFFSSFKFMPAGLMVIASVVMLAALLCPTFRKSQLI